MIQVKKEGENICGKSGHHQSNFQFYHRQGEKKKMEEDASKEFFLFLSFPSKSISFFSLAAKEEKVGKRGMDRKLSFYFRAEEEEEKERDGRA